MNKLLHNPLLWIVGLAAVLRLSFLGSVPISLNWDEVSMGYTAYSVAETGMDEWGERLPIFFRSYGEWKSAVYIYLLVPLVKLLGMNAWAVRLPSAIAGILAVWLTYLIGKKIYSEKAGLWAALFLAISPWHLMLSRPAFEANVSLTLILAGIYFFLASLPAFNYKLLTLSAIFFGLAPHTYNSAKVVVPFMVIYLVWRSGIYKNIRKVFVFGAILAAFAMPIAINLLSGRAQHRYTQVGVSTDIKSLNEFANYRNNSNIPKIAGRLIFNKYTYTLYSTSRNWLTYLSPSFLLAEAGDHTQHHLPYFGVIYLVEFGAVIVGLYAFSQNLFTNNFRLLPIVIIVLGIIPAALTRENGHVLRSILTLPGWQLLAGVGVAYLQQIRFRYLKLAGSLLGIQAFFFILAYFVWYPQAFARDWQYGYRELAAYLREHEHEYSQIVMTKWYGESQLFLAFYNRWDPAWYIEANQPNLEYEKQGKLWLDQLDQYSLGKYTFKYLDFTNEKRTKDILYIGKADDFYENPETLKTIYFPDGSVAFHLVAGERDK